MYILKLWVLLYAVWTSCVCSRSEDSASANLSTDLLNSIRMSPDCIARVPGVISDLLKVLQTRFPGCKAEKYGSVAMGLAIIHSDIDNDITLHPEDPATNLTIQELILETAHVLLQHPKTFEVIHVAPLATAPIVTAKHLPSQFSIDITFGAQYAIRSAKLIHHLMTFDQRAKDLAQILKYWARVHNLIGHNKLSSYNFVTMAIFYLQQNQILPPVGFLQLIGPIDVVDHWNTGFSNGTYRSDNVDSLCAILGGFFTYYKEFDFEKYIVSPYVGYPVEVSRLKKLHTVPEELEFYILNVGFNITEPLKLDTSIVQDLFQHNRNLIHSSLEPAHQQFVQEAKIYADRYQDDCAGYIEEVLKYK